MRIPAFFMISGLQGYYNLALVFMLRVLPVYRRGINAKNQPLIAPIPYSPNPPIPNLPKFYPNGV